MLSVEDRRILVLRHISGYSNVELEKILKISGQTVRKRISRARHRLQAIMLDHGAMHEPITFSQQAVISGRDETSRKIFLSDLDEK
jgi:predicted DNA-binding protein (UPF0251 family)